MRHAVSLALLSCLALSASGCAVMMLGEGHEAGSGSLTDAAAQPGIPPRLTAGADVVRAGPPWPRSAAGPKGGREPTLAAGTILRPYKILAPLGAGGMGEVYRARDTRPGREGAMKVNLTELARDPDRIKRFEKEAPGRRQSWRHLADAISSAHGPVAQTDRAAVS